jgi:hypothetical protein
MTARIVERYQIALQSIPAPGGNGCHPALLGAANLGIIAGKEPHEIHSDLRQAIPQGTRLISNREIHDAISKALSDQSGGTFSQRQRSEPTVHDGRSALQRIIDQGKISDEADLWECSPLRLWNKPQGDPIIFLETLYKPTDFLWIGERYQAGILGYTIRTAGEWIRYFKTGGKILSHIILNPLTGDTARTKSGTRDTFRGDGNVKCYKYALVEFDTLSREDQIRFWSAAKLPVVALVDTGGKSIHAWLQVSKLAEITTKEQWQHHVKGRLYEEILIPLGVDRACSNPAHLSRLPGCLRAETEHYQRILWLSYEGRRIIT